MTSPRNALETAAHTGRQTGRPSRRRTARGRGAALCALAAQLGLCISEGAIAAPDRAEVSRVDEAQERFHRGVALYEEGDSEGALVELKRAYEMAPNFKILYNLGQISYQARDYPAALDYFRRYLYDGGWRVPQDRRRQVEAEIQTLRGRTGHVDVQVPDAGVVITVDDGAGGITPLASPLLVGVGRHRIEATWPSGQRQVQFADVAGNENLVLTFESKATPIPPLSLAAAEKAMSSTASADSAEASVIKQKEGDREEEPPAPSRMRTRTWVAWSITAALATGAAVTGGLAWQKSNQADDALGTFPVSRSDVDDLRSQQRTLAGVSDAFLLGSLVMAGVSLYLTRASTGEHASSPAAPTATRLATASR